MAKRYAASSRPEEYDMKTVEQLRERMLEIINIKNEHDRQDTAMLWWESLSSDEQECVQDKITIPTINALQDLWETIVDSVMNDDTDNLKRP